MPRLQYIAHTELGVIINSIQIDKDIGKHQALKLLINLANENMNYPIRNFAGDKNVNCTLDVSSEEYSKFKDYRRLHNLTKANEFFRDALKRGAAYYQDHPEKDSE